MDIEDDAGAEAPEQFVELSPDLIVLFDILVNDVLTFV
jgi:hypothetical protein